MAPVSSNPPRNVLGVGGKFHYYVTETYGPPGNYIVPAIRAGIRMANPPGEGSSKYPKEWSQGAEAFGRNYGDAFAQRASTQTGRFVTGVIFGEDPRYIRSTRHNFLARSFHAFSFTVVDRSNSGHCMPAMSNLVGAAAGGFVGNAYLPTGFNDVTHAGQRATMGFAGMAVSNLFQEFAPRDSWADTYILSTDWSIAHCDDTHRYEDVDG